MELQDENEALKESISKLTEEISDKQKELDAEKELRSTSVQDARSAERANAQLELQDLRKSLTSAKMKELAGVREELRLKAKAELETLQELKDREVVSLQKKLTEAEKARQSAEQDVDKVRNDISGKNEAELKRLHRAMFEIEEARDKLKNKVETLTAADKEKADLIRQLKENHDKELKRQSQEAKQDSKKQMEELKEMERKLGQKEKDYVALSEKASRFEMEKDQLDDKLHRMKEAEAWEKMSPRNSIQGEPFTPFGRKYSEHEKETLVRNSELSYLSRSLQDKNKALETERNEMKEKAESAELQNQPLHDKVEKLLKKVDHLTAGRSSLEKKIASLNTETIDLRSAKQDMEAELEKQKRNFQRQLNDSRARGHSVAQMRGEMLSLEDKVAELTAANDKLKATNQRRTKELGRLRKKLSKMTPEESMTQSLDSQSENVEDEGDTGSMESTEQLHPSSTSLSESSHLGASQEIETQDQSEELGLEGQKEDLERKIEDLEAELEGLRLSAEERDDLKEEVEELRTRLEDLEGFILEQDEVKSLMQQNLEGDLETARKEIFDLQEQMIELKQTTDNQQQEDKQEAGKQEVDGTEMADGVAKDDEGPERPEEAPHEDKSAPPQVPDSLTLLQAQVEDLQNVLEEKDKRIKVLEHAILQNRAQLRKAGIPEGDLAPSDADELTDTLLQLEESEQQLKEIYSELLDNPLHLALENQRLEEELRQVKLEEEQLSQQMAELSSVLTAACAEKDRAEQELAQAQEWLDQDQMAAVEREHLREELENARNRIRDLEEMQESLLERGEAVLPPGPVAPASAQQQQQHRPRLVPQRSDSVMKRKTGAKAIAKSINVVEGVQDTVLRLREKILALSHAGAAGSSSGRPSPKVGGERGDQSTFSDSPRPEEVEEEMVLVQLEDDVEAEIVTLASLLGGELESLNKMKEEIEEDERKQIVSKDPLEEQFLELERERNALLEELKQFKNGSVGAASEYETPATARGKLDQSEEDLDHVYSELELRRRASGLYEPVDFKGRKAAGKKPLSTTSDDDDEDDDDDDGLPKNEEEPVEPKEKPVPEVTPKLATPPGSGWSQDVNELQEDVKRLQESLVEQRMELEQFKANEEELKQILDTIQPEKEELKKRVEALTTDEQTLSNDIENYEQQLKVYKQELSGVKEKLFLTAEEQEALQKEKKQLNRLLSEREEELSLLSNQVPQLQRIVSLLEEEQESWNEERSRLREQVDGNPEAEMWKEKYDSLCKQIDSDLMRELQSQMDNLRTLLEEKDKQIEDLHRQVEKKRNESMRRKRRSKVFVALFDYEPLILCHTGHPEQELEFKEGDILEVEGDLDQKGFYHATLNYVPGLVPANFVEEVDITDPNVRQRLFNQRLGQSDTDALRSAVSPVSLVEDIIDEEQDVEENADSPFVSLNRSSFSPKLLPPTQIKVEDCKYGTRTSLSWQPPRMSPAGFVNGKEIAGYFVAVNKGKEHFVKGAASCSISLRGIDMSSLSGVKICTTAIDGARSDWVNVTVATQITSHQPPLSPTPLSASYDQSSLYDSLKLGQSAMSPEVSFAAREDRRMSQPESLLNGVDHQGGPQEGIPHASSDNVYEVLYDYDPASTSEVVSEEELPLKAGMVVKLLEAEREDGLAKAQVNGKVGLVPISFLEKRSSQQQPSQAQSKPMRNTPSASVLPWENKKEVVALFNYYPAKDSPNVNKESELPFKKGQRITILGEMDVAGFYVGVSEGKQGLVPSNFVQEITTY